ncbi:glycosyltransferase [Parasediminibacterium sp. JCM 36343]|uniref:glycosyltransferase n=1 Tax=Parasediminibacterium sp. JCM 36343 TaxID=3374279 RepID=UPI00397AE48E
MQLDFHQIGLIGFVIFCLVAAIQVFYYVFLFRRLAVYQAPPPSNNHKEPVSVIICARDEADNLVNNLPGILVQEYPDKHEIIVVNDNSTDQSKYIIEEFMKAFDTLQHLQLKQEAKMIIGKKFPLSMGIKTAKHEVLLLTDADCVPASEHWVKQFQDAYRDGIEIVLGYGAYHKKEGVLNKIIRFETFHSAMQYFSYALAGIPYMGVGRNLSYKRDVFMRNKGFSSINMIPSGDDDLFINRVATKSNTAILIDPASHTLSEAKATWSDWLKQKYRHYTTTKYYQPKHKLWLGLYSVSFGLLYPLAFLSAIFFSWWMALVVLAFRWLVQAFVYYGGMKKLNEFDLFPFFILFDIWMFFYYIVAVPSLWRKPKRTWN